MVQREVLRVCEENIHIPHCLFLCNAVYYCGSISLTKLADGKAGGEEFFLRGRGKFCFCDNSYSALTSKDI
jgi:hypothetical protein